MKSGNKIILVIGIIAFAAGIYILSRELSFRKNAVQTQGTVVSTLGSTFHVQYFTTDGTEKVKRFSTKTNHNRAGDIKTVWYIPSKPEKAKLDNGTSGGKMLLKIALVCLILGVYPLFLKKRAPTNGTQ